MSSIKYQKIFQEGKYIKFDDSMEKSQLDLFQVNQKYNEVLTIDSYLNSQNSINLAQNLKYYDQFTAFCIRYKSLISFTEIEELCKNLKYLEKLKYLQIQIESQEKCQVQPQFLIGLENSLKSIKDLEHLNLEFSVPETEYFQSLEKLKIQLENLKKLVSLKFKFTFQTPESRRFLDGFDHFFINLQQIQDLDLNLFFQRQQNKLVTIIPRIHHLQNLKKLQIRLRDKDSICANDIFQLQQDLKSLDCLNKLSLVFENVNFKLIKNLNDLLNTSLVLKNLQKLKFQTSLGFSQEYQFIIGSILNSPSNLRKLKLKFDSQYCPNECFETVFDDNIINLFSLQQIELDLQLTNIYETSYQNLGNLFIACKNLENLIFESKISSHELMIFGQKLSKITSLKQFQLGLLMREFQFTIYDQIDSFAGLHQLQILKIVCFYCFLSENQVNSLKNLVNLKIFSLNSIVTATNQDLESFGHSLKYLKNLNSLEIKLSQIQDYQNISQISNSISSLVNLKTLNIQLHYFFLGSFFLDVNYFIQLFNNLSSLNNIQELNLHFQTQPQFELQFDKALVNSLIDLPRLRKIKVNLQNQTISKLLKKLKKLVIFYAI